MCVSVHACRGARVRRGKFSRDPRARLAPRGRKETPESSVPPKRDRSWERPAAPGRAPLLGARRSPLCQVPSRPRARRAEVGAQVLLWERRPAVGESPAGWDLRSAFILPEAELIAEAARRRLVLYLLYLT